MNKRDFEPLHPGEVLLEEYLKPKGVSRNALALSMRVPAQRIGEIVQGRRAISADTAIRLAKVIGTTPQFWLSLQMEYDLQIAQQRIESNEGALLKNTQLRHQFN